MESEQELLRETYRLAKENNKMLHAMRRNAFLGGLLKIVIYFVLFIVIPVWLYMTYLAPVVDQMLKTMNQIQTAGTQAQTQMTDWQKTFQDLQAKIPGMSSTSGN
jgi:predicted PurR-regulated permease PerM